MVTVSNLPVGTTPTGTEPTVVVQSGNTVRLTLDQARQITTSDLKGASLELVLPGGAGRITLVHGSDGGGNRPSLNLYQIDEEYPRLALGSVFNIPTLFFGTGTAIPSVLLSLITTSPAVLGLGTTGTGTLLGGRAQAINAQTGTAYTLVLDDGPKQITRNNAGASTQTYPQNSDAALTVGIRIPTINLGAGALTHQAGTGATVVTSGTQPQNTQWTAVKTGTNAWWVGP